VTARWTSEDLDAYIARLKAPIVARASVTKPPKYRNQKTRDASGVLHDGKGELKRWEELKLLEHAGSIRCLRRQVPYALVVEGLLIATYIADFVYQDGEATIVEDHKSAVTRKLRDFRMKLKLMQALHKVQIREV
jgi:hypothetical protein